MHKTEDHILRGFTLTLSVLSTTGFSGMVITTLLFTGPRELETIMNLVLAGSPARVFLHHLAHGSMLFPALFILILILAPVMALLVTAINMFKNGDLATALKISFLVAIIFAAVSGVLLLP